ncbi:MAG: hypothetical protein RTU63_10070 [Candidatus Thorarchaeota archaeon]
MYNARIRKTELPKVPHSMELNISNRQTLNRSAVRMATAVVGTGLLVFAVSFLPGLVLFVLPGMIALVGKAYDEAKLIQYLRYGDPIRTEHWENTEAHTERIRIQSAENRSSFATF